MRGSRKEQVVWCRLAVVGSWVSFSADGFFLSRVSASMVEVFVAGLVGYTRNQNHPESSIWTFGTLGRLLAANRVRSLALFLFGHHNNINSFVSSVWLHTNVWKDLSIPPPLLVPINRIAINMSTAEEEKQVAEDEEEEEEEEDLEKLEAEIARMEAEAAAMESDKKDEGESGTAKLSADEKVAQDA